MAQRRGNERGQSVPARPHVVVHVKLSAQDRNTLKAVLSLEGSTMQEYFAAKAAERIRGTAVRADRQRDALPVVSPADPMLAPGQTYQMPTGRYIHWCRVCGNLWRSHEAQPEYCGQRYCHSPQWRTGTLAEDTTQRRRGRRPRHSAGGQVWHQSKAETERIIGSKD